MMKGTYYSAPMRKWEAGVPVGASSKPFITGSGSRFSQDKPPNTPSRTNTPSLLVLPPPRTNTPSRTNDQKMIDAFRNQKKTHTKYENIITDMLGTEKWRDSNKPKINKLWKQANVLADNTSKNSQLGGGKRKTKRRKNKAKKTKYTKRYSRKYRRSRRIYKK